MQRSYFYILDSIFVSHTLDCCYVLSSIISNKKVGYENILTMHYYLSTVKEHPPLNLYISLLSALTTQSFCQASGCRVFSYCSPFLLNDLLVDNGQTLLKPLNLNSKTTVYTDGKSGKKKKNGAENIIWIT